MSSDNYVRFSGPIAPGTAVDTEIGLGFVVGHIVDNDQNITAYLVTFDFIVPGNMRPLSNDPIVPAVAWAFKPGSIIITEGGLNRVH